MRLNPREQAGHWETKTRIQTYMQQNPSELQTPENDA